MSKQGTTYFEDWLKDVSFPAPRTKGDLLAELEEEYLNPSPRLSLAESSQINIPYEPNYLDYMQLDPTPWNIRLVPARNVDGDVVGWKREGGGKTSSLENPKNSLNLDREPSAPTDFVRGKQGNLPFVPGGMEDVLANKKTTSIDSSHLFVKEKLVLTEADPLKWFDTLKESINLPNLSSDESFPTGLTSSDWNVFLAEEESELFSKDTNIDQLIMEVLQWTVSSEPSQSLKEQPRKISEIKELNTEYNTVKSQDTTIEEVDDLLPQEELETANVILSKSANPLIAKREWAHVVDVNRSMDDFYDLVPDLAFQYPFELDTFQKQAIYHLEQGDSVFVAAHTSAGKTVVAEYAIALATKHMARCIYTSPIKALSNQKFRDFQKTFADVGILTGDVQINPEASCLIMTTEILRSMLYRGADLIRDVEFVIFDEVHYVNDTERGVVWEEVIIMLPAHVTLILLSATVPNTMEFAGWVGRTKRKDIYVISTLKRPVPLEHYLYAGSDMHKIVDANGQFLSQGWKNANESSMRKQQLLQQKSGQNNQQPKGPNARGGTANRGRGSGGGGRDPRYGTSSKVINTYKTIEKQDKNMWVHLVGLLRKRQLLPTVIFTFSKKKCEEYADGLTNVDISTAVEKSEIHVFIERSLGRLRGTDRELPQILKMRELLKRGVAVHHGGLLPIMKEMVEILFARGLVKVLFATETFAMGVNMPAKTVVFSGLRKHDGVAFRDLLPGEYTQMSGRAGRRGLDDTGIVIIAPGGEVPESVTLNKIILGKPTRLNSQFRLTYNMILNLLRVESLKVEEMIKRSFSENTSQKQLPEREKLLAENTKYFNAVEKLTCDICLQDLNEFYDICQRIMEHQMWLMDRVMHLPLGAKWLNTGRVVVVNTSEFRRYPAVIIRPMPAQLGGKGSFVCLVLTPELGEQKTGFFAPTPILKLQIPTAFKEDLPFMLYVFTFMDFAMITKHTIKFDAEAIYVANDIPEIQRVTTMLYRVGELLEQGNLEEEEVDWSKIRELEFQERYAEKQKTLTSLQNRQFICQTCPLMEQHYSVVYRERELKAKLEELRRIISDQNLELLPEYEQRIQVLKQMSFVDAQSTVQLKGRVACEMNSADELVLTELVLDNVFAEFEAAEIVALLSSFVFQEKTDDPPILTPRLERGIERLVETAQRVGAIQRSCGLHLPDPEDLLHFGLVEVVYEWARGMPFKKIMELTTIQEGSIVRCITRLDETCREVRDAARLVGDHLLFKKMEDAGMSIKRDIVFAASLYF